MIFGVRNPAFDLLHHQDRREHPQAGEPAAVRLEKGDGDGDGESDHVPEKGDHVEETQGEADDESIPQAD